MVGYCVSEELKKQQKPPPIRRGLLFSGGLVLDSRTGAEIVLNVLVDEGVDVIFGYPGRTIMPLYDVLYSHGVRHILVRHEAAATFAASGYARTTGRVGVCVATSGPGATNLVTGIADAMLDNVPLVALTGQVRSAVMGTDAFQEVDIAGITQGITKRNDVVRNIGDIEPALRRAFQCARGGRPGPVLVDLPTDVLKARLNTAELKPRIFAQEISHVYDSCRGRCGCRGGAVPIQQAIDHCWRRSSLEWRGGSISRVLTAYRRSTLCDPPRLGRGGARGPAVLRHGWRARYEAREPGDRGYRLSRCPGHAL